MFKDSLTGTVIVPSDNSYSSRVASTNARWTRNPGMIVLAQTVSDVQKAVLFARKFYLNLVYSSSGVDYFGRGLYDGSLKLDLSQLKFITTSDLNNFSQGGTVTASAGSTWDEMYAQVESSIFPRALAGGSKSLETVDTFTMTGGLGPLSRTLGLAADNLLSAQIVLADGRNAIVSSSTVSVTDEDGEVQTYEDSDLLRAIKGGGITWGVPVGFTYSLQNAPGEYASLTASYLVVDNGQVTGRSTLRSILSEMANLPVQWGGYISIDGAPSNTFPNDRGEIKYHLFSYGRYDFLLNQNNFNSPIERLRNILNLNGISPTTNTLPSLAQYRNDVAETEQHFTDKPNTYVMNTLINADVITNSEKLDQLVELMMDVVNSPTVSSNYRCIGKLAGGKVSSPNSVTDNYVNEKMREALFSWTCALSWDDGITREDYYIGQAQDFQKRLRALGNGGVDPYYAGEDLEDWRTAIYGSKYFELLNIKKKWDVDNFLWAHNAVASDFELNCRNLRCPHRH